MKRLGLFSLLVLNSFITLGATSLDECFALIDVFGSSSEKIQLVIDDYELALGRGPSDSGTKLALAMLYVALLSRRDAADPENGERAKKALGYVEEFLIAESGNDLGLLFCGIAHSLRARDSRNPLTRMHEMGTAVANLDKAVEVTKGSTREWYVRFMRANTYANTPRAMGKWGVAEEDYRFLFDFMKEHPERESYLVAANYYRALINKKKGDRNAARECLRRSAEFEERYRTGTSEAALAATLLKELEEGAK